MLKFKNIKLKRPEDQEDFFRLAKRDLMDPKKVWAIRIGSFIVALLIGALIFALLGHNPITAYGHIINGSLGKKSGIRQTIKGAVPLLGTALALAPCFKMKYWNIGAEGQITFGAIAASFFALNFGNSWSMIPLLLTMAVASIVGGALWSAVPAYFKSRWGTNETLFTLMMNYIAIGLVKWLQGGPWEGKPGSQIIPMFNDNAVLPKVLGVHCGWIIVLILTVVMWVYLKYTKQGFEIAVIGESENTARYAGMDVARITIRTACISGGICGLVGFMIASGANNTLYSDVAAGAGFTAITVCWLAQLNPFAMIVIASIMAILSKGASTLQTNLQVPASVSDIITGIILLCMLGCEFFINYKMIFNRSFRIKKKVTNKEVSAQ